MGRETSPIQPTPFTQPDTYSVSFSALNTGEYSRNRGIESETNAANAIATSPKVQWIEMTPQYSEHDVNGVDLIVGLTPDAKKVEQVNVQVKSSRNKMNRFRRKLREKHGLEPGQLTTWLQANKIIILNGQRSQEEIASSFAAQLEGIITYASSPQPIDVYTA